MLAGRGTAFRLDGALAADRGGNVVSGFAMLGCFSVDLVVEEWCSAGAGRPGESGVDEREQRQQDSRKLAAVRFAWSTTIRVSHCGCFRSRAQRPR